MTQAAPPTPTHPDTESPHSAAQAPSPWARGGPWLIMLAGAILSLTLVARIPDEVFFSGDGGLKALLVKQFASGRWACDLRLPAEPWLGQLWEKGAYPFAPPFVYPLRGGQYLAFPATFPFVTAPFYACFGYYGLYVLPLAGLWLTWLQFHWLCKRFGLPAAESTLSMAGLVLATPLTLYGAMYWEHTLGVALAFAGLAQTLAPSNAKRSLSGYVIGGLLLGLSVWFRPECLCVAAAVIVAFFVLSKRNGAWGPWGALAAATLVMVAAFAALNFLLYRNPLGAHALQVTEGFDFAGHLVKAARYCLWLNIQLLFYVPLVVFILLVTLLPLFGRPLKLTPTLSYLLTVLVLASIAVPLIIPHTGGRTWGPRFLLCSAPVATLAAGLLLRQIRQEQRRRQRLLALVIFLGALLGGAALNTAVGTRKLDRNYATRVRPALDFLRHSRHDVVVVTHQWVAQELQPLLEYKHFLRIDRPSDLEELAPAIREQGYDGFVLVWARYEEGQPEQRFEFEGQRVAVSGPLIGKLGWDFYVYDCAILDRP